MRYLTNLNSKKKTPMVMETWRKQVLRRRAWVVAKIAKVCQMHQLRDTGHQVQLLGAGLCCACLSPSSPAPTATSQLKLCSFCKVSAQWLQSRNAVGSHCHIPCSSSSPESPRKSTGLAAPPPLRCRLDRRSRQGSPLWGHAVLKWKSLSALENQGNLVKPA